MGEFVQPISPIPTEYRGTRFRSRLEAKWAAFFDLCKWEWEYEPLDLRGYIPDFILKFSKPVLFEVKPEMGLESLKRYIPKICSAGWIGEAVVVGATIHTHEDASILGLIFDPQEEDEADTSDYVRFIHCSNCNLGLNAFWGGWGCRKCGFYGGNAGFSDFSYDRITALFREAGNMVQWLGHSSLRPSVELSEKRVCTYCGITEVNAERPHQADHSDGIVACHTCIQAKKGRTFLSIEDCRSWLHWRYWSSGRKKYDRHRKFAFQGKAPTQETLMRGLSIHLSTTGRSGVV